MGLSRRDDLVFLNGLRRSFADRRSEQVLMAIDQLIAEIEQEIATEAAASTGQTKSPSESDPRRDQKEEPGTR